jgi:hypothetical protein
MAQHLSRSGLAGVWRCMALALVWCAVAAVAGPAARAQEKVDIALVLAVDVSLSIDDEEFALQRAGYAAAFRNPRVVDAITAGGTGVMAVSYIQWSGASEQKQIIGWRLIRDTASAAAFAQELATAERLVASGSTSISGAIDVSARLLQKAPFEAARKVIDISGDGYNNSGRLPIYARDEAVAAGIVINGLAILKNEPQLDGYYERNVMGGAGAFVITAADFGDFAEAILGKLVREVAALDGGLDCDPVYCSRKARRKLSSTGDSAYIATVCSPVLIETSAGMPGIISTPKTSLSFSSSTRILAA